MGLSRSHREIPVGNCPHAGHCNGTLLLSQGKGSTTTSEEANGLRVLSARLPIILISLLAASQGGGRCALLALLLSSAGGAALWETRLHSALLLSGSDVGQLGAEHHKVGMHSVLPRHPIARRSLCWLGFPVKLQTKPRARCANHGNETSSLPTRSVGYH